ncbi:hypothetical protein PPL_09054 [Heterostelium album PN500]|uniref:Uncharacterized protein n=1 Tax=Heterostelium pallidum (strain ATCC 26659 / Pp 5 / PN500) TaxID=670386 RepID=D3BKH3_HETP5|nr:hypothetical protein PPL_09054 [Heterostelium album PN500]EFA78403.1 hypothetical protein PPL_09054 [Heterostelium album PN500]|eukprot:XP_020430528.1 hypothetical protein PPL_09054 [Heterostelium album PN500]
MELQPLNQSGTSISNSTSSDNQNQNHNNDINNNNSTIILDNNNSKNNNCSSSSITNSCMNSPPVSSSHVCTTSTSTSSLSSPSQQAQQPQQNVSTLIMPTGSDTIQRTIEKDIMLSLGKHVVVTSTVSNPALKSFSEIIEKKDCQNSSIHYWIELQSLNEDEITEICELLGVHSLTISDINKREYDIYDPPETTDQYITGDENDQKRSGSRLSNAPETDTLAASAGQHQQHLHGENVARGIAVVQPGEPKHA